MKLLWPLKFSLPNTEPLIGQGFGEHQADYASLGLIGHDGVDFPEPLGTAVYAAHDGYIVYVNNTDKNIGYGIKQYFEENGQGYELSYWHFKDTLFPNQQYIMSDRHLFIHAGDLIAHVDTTGFSFGNHLHFGLRLVDPKTLNIINYNNGYKGGVNPLPYFRNKGATVQLTTDGATFWLEGDKGKIGIADLGSLEMIQSISSEAATQTNPSTPELQTLSQGYILNRKAN